MDTVFIHTNEKQLIGAIVSAHSMRRNSRAPGSFEVKIIRLEDYPWYAGYEGKNYLREGRDDVWRMDDLQTFTTLRFMPPELMAYRGRAAVVDPDVFAVGDPAELLKQDMQGKAVCARIRAGHKGYQDYIATSVMLLDCAKLKHWNVRQWFAEMFEKKRDYEIWMRLGYEPRETVGALESTWNDFDRLAADTKMLHNTKRRTQPWKTGLAVDFTNRAGLFGLLPASWAPAGWIKRTKLPGSYWRHPDRRQEQYFFALLRECLDNGMVTEQQLRLHMTKSHVRHDAMDIIRQVPRVDEILGVVKAKAA